MFQALIDLRDRHTSKSTAAEADTSSRQLADKKDHHT